MRRTWLFYIFFIQLLCILWTPALAQKAASDSLEVLLSNSQLDTQTRILSLCQLANSTPLDQLDKAIEANKKAIALAQKQRYEDGLCLAWSQQVQFEMIQRDGIAAQQAADSMLYHAQNASELYKGIAYFRMGYLQNLQNKPEEAFESWEKAIPMLEENDGQKYLSSIYYLKFGIYAERENQKEASRYAELALESAQKSKDIDAEIKAWQIKGTYEVDLFEQKGRTIHLQAAKDAFEQSISLYKQHQTYTKNPSVVALSALYLANLYLEYDSSLKRKDIMEYVNLALQTSKEVNNIEMQANTYAILSKIHMQSANWAAAEQALLTQRVLADSLPSPNYYLELKNLELLATLQEKQGDPEQALEYYKKYVATYKKVFDSEQTEIIQQLEAQYENDKKNKELELLHQKNAFQKRQTWLYSAIAIITITGLLFLFIAYRFRLKYALERQKLQDEEAARLKAEQTLIAQEKEQLQKELMVGMLQIERGAESLKELKEKIATAESQHPQLNQFIKEELRINSDFDLIRSEIQAIHPEFFKQLQDKASEKLTQTDLRYCAYFSLQFSTKQIAELLNVTPKSVRMAKYRLKQKFELDKEDDFDAFLQGLS
ncbi:transcriptional regulator [Myroides indicus]|nr:tetratricopeptide repeat protein [Myroides indicus]